MPEPILLATETTGLEFQTPGGWIVIHIDSHAGGTITLQSKSPEQLNGVDVWIDTDVTFDQSQQRGALTFQGMSYRLSGGTAGARAWKGVGYADRSRP